MKKITILFIVFFIANTMTLKAQVAISKNAVFLKSSEFENKRFDDFKKTTTIFVLNNLYEKKQYEEMLKSSWTITPFEVVDLKHRKHNGDVKLPQRADYRSCGYDWYSPCEFTISAESPLL